MSSRMENASICFILIYEIKKKILLNIDNVDEIQILGKLNYRNKQNYNDYDKQ